MRLMGVSKVRELNRGNLRWRASERFTLAGLRGILGVPKGRLTTWSNLRLRAIDPAVQEVNRLSDYQVEILPSKTGRSVTHVELHWRRKERGSTGADTAAVAAKPRPAKPRPAWLDRHGPPLASQTEPQTHRLFPPTHTDIYLYQALRTIFGRVAILT